MISMKDLGSEKGTYILIFKANKNTCCEVGRLGLLQVKTGYYLYVGSAFGPGGIAARLKHHLSIAVRPHWHLDYVRPYLQPLEAWVSCSPSRLEHQWAGLLSGLRGAQIPLPGIGATDCRCRSHLYYFLTAPGFDKFQRPQQTEVRRIVL